MKSFIPIFDKHKNIKSCVKSCEIGENEKCLKCYKDKCRKCNQGYKLDKGKCILNHSFKAIYRTSKIKENINFIFSRLI